MSPPSVSRPIPGVTALLANPSAVQANTRFIDQDLNRSFPGDPITGPFEPRRAAQIMQACTGYDLILDFHNTLASANDCAFIGPNPDRTILQAADRIGLRRVIIAEYDCINKYLPNCLSIEVSVTSPRMAIEPWMDVLTRLAKIKRLDNNPQLELYRYVETLTLADRDKFNLDQAGLRVFEPIPARVASLLGQPSPVYPIFLGQNYTAGIYAGLITKL